MLSLSPLLSVSSHTPPYILHQSVRKKERKRKREREREILISFYIYIYIGYCSRFNNQILEVCVCVERERERGLRRITLFSRVEYIYIYHSYTLGHIVGSSINIKRVIERENEFAWDITLFFDKFENTYTKKCNLA